MLPSENELAYDPIISFYLKLSKPCIDDEDTPIFSETMLRLSFKEVFSALRPLKSDELELYRKLLLLYYSVNYSDFRAIMTCFDENIIRTYLRDRETILTEWCQFYNDKLAAIAYKESLNEILLEYTVRYIKLFGHITKQQVKKKAKDIQDFHGFYVKLPRQFLSSFNSLLQNKLAAQNQNYNNLTQDDLKLKNIFEHIKHKLNYFVVKEVSQEVHSSEEEEVEPPSKKTKVTESNVIKLGTSKVTESNVIKLGTSLHSLKPKVSESESINDKISTSEVMSNKFYVYDDCDDDEINFVEVNDEDNELENTEEESAKIWQQFEEINERVNVSDEVNDPTDEINERVNVIDEVNDPTDIVDNNTRNPHIVNYNTAMEYLAALQAYAVVNEHLEAIELLDNVDDIFRT